MSSFDTEIFLDGFQFAEGIRWHKNNLWFCDVWDQKVHCFNLNGFPVKEIVIDDRPIGLGWLSDGTLLITSLMKRELLQYSDNQLSIFKTLEIAAPGYCHDFTVSHNDVIYLSASGFYPSYNVKPVKSNILMITSNKDIKAAATNIGYPNGIVITPDDKNLIVAETFSASISIFEIAEDGTLVNQKLWAKLDNLGFQVTFDKQGIPTNKNRHYPDGICYDSKLNAVWMASPGRKEVLCVGQDSKILRTIYTRSLPFDCILGGKNNRTLFIASSDVVKDKRTGKIEMLET